MAWKSFPYFLTPAGGSEPVEPVLSPPGGSRTPTEETGIRQDHSGQQLGAFTCAPGHAHTRNSTHLSLEGHQLHVQLAKEGVGGGRAAGHGHHVLLGQVSGWTPGVLRVRSLDRWYLSSWLLRLASFRACRSIRLVLDRVFFQE
ncbi:hypothetical protein INR49_000109 [Caranx melampygus]|nr:hypothetical protein INR49_000109 [Caranx melampygus]